MISQTEIEQIACKLPEIIDFDRRHGTPKKKFWSITDQEKWRQLLSDYPLFDPQRLCRKFHHADRDCICEQDECSCFDIVYWDHGGQMWRLNC